MDLFILFYIIQRHRAALICVAWQIFTDTTFISLHLFLKPVSSPPASFIFTFLPFFAGMCQKAVKVDMRKAACEGESPLSTF